MKFTAAVALFTASVQAGDWPLDKAPDNLPKGQCLVWPANKDGCDSQWAQFDDYCGQFEDEACEEVEEAWYNQDADWEWKASDRPENECFGFNLSTECKEEWELIRKRCDNKGVNDDTEGPYDWTIECDVAHSLLGGLELWFAGDDTQKAWKPVDSSNFPDSKAPKDECFVWETSDDGTCRDQWNLSDGRCDEEWTRDCANIDARWYSQELEWVTPTRPTQKCFGFNDIGDDCVLEWQILWAQCTYAYDNTEDKYYFDEPYMWTNSCEATEMLIHAVDKWHYVDDDFYYDDTTYEDDCVEGMDDCYQDHQPVPTPPDEDVEPQDDGQQERRLGKRSHATLSNAFWRKQSADKATSAATALLDKPAKMTQKEQQKADYSGYAYGAAAATFGICATVALAKRYQNKKLSDDYVRV